jgi:hypothetical protein
MRPLSSRISRKPSQFVKCDGVLPVSAKAMPAAWGKKARKLVGSTVQKSAI